MAELLLAGEMRKLRKFDKDLDWFLENSEKLKKEYKGEYVAVKEQKIVDHDKDAKILLKRMKGKYGDISSLVVEYVNERKVEYILANTSP